MGALAIILARAGSKGVPGKNIALVGGRECVRWTIDDACAARRVSRIAISTDSPEIQEIALECGADVVARPAALASDTAAVDDAVRHAVSALEAKAARTNDPVVILYANVPVRPAGLIDRALGAMIESHADCVQSYAPVGKHHPWWTARIDAISGEVRAWEGETLNHGVFRRQDLPPAFIPDGGVLVVTRPALFLEIAGVAPGPHAFFGKHRCGVVNEEGGVVDIDSSIDLLVADAILRERGSER